MSAISLKLLVDKWNNKVVFAESDKDFVDILFGFLTMPVGTVVRVLNMQSSLGCMDKLYGSVEDLSTKNMETEACKAMLLRPRSAADSFCKELLDDIDCTNPEKFHPFYMLPDWDAPFSEATVTQQICLCGKTTNKCYGWPAKHEGGEGNVFARGESKYIISDDLRVAPASIASTLRLLQDRGFKDAGTLKTRFVHVCKAEVLALLKGSLLSGTPLTDVFLRNMFSIDMHDKPTRLFGKKHEPIKPAARIKLEDENVAPDQRKTITVKLLQNKNTNEVVYAEAGHDFVDALFSFLTFPLGSIVKLLNKRCIDNLFESAVEIGDGAVGIKAEETVNMLTAWYVKRSARFMVTNEMVVTPLSPISGVDVIRALKVPIGSLVEREVSFGEERGTRSMKIMGMVEGRAVMRGRAMEVETRRARGTRSQVNMDRLKEKAMIARNMVAMIRMMRKRSATSISTMAAATMMMIEPAVA